MATLDKIKQKRRVLHALLAKNKLMDAKQHILAGEGVEHVTDLSERQLDGLINWATGLQDQKAQLQQHELRQWRHKCLNKMRSCGVDTTDWNRVNAFVLDKRVAGKHLYHMSLDELKVLHRKLHNIAIAVEKRNAAIQRLTQLN
jgi:hypothetical protein